MPGTARATDLPTGDLPENGRVIDLKGLRRRNWPYVLVWVVYYAWVVAFATWWTSSPLVESVFGPNLRTLLHSINLLSSAVFILVIHREWFIQTARIGAVLIVTGMLLFMFATSAKLQLCAAVMIGISLGCVNTSILTPFVFTLNNTEKFYAVVGSNLLIGCLTLSQAGSPASFIERGYGLWVSFAILLAALGAICFFRPDALPMSPDSPQAGIPSRVYLTLVINCVFVVLCKGAGKGLLDVAATGSSFAVYSWYYLGGLVGCLLYFAIYALSKNSIHLAWNVTFGSLTMGLFLNAFTDRRAWLAVGFAILLGIGSTIGMINVYYILGVIGKKYDSMRYLRLSILFIGICGGVSGIVVGRLINSIEAEGVSMAASVFSAGVVLLFLIASPALGRTYYGDEWAADSAKMEVDNEQLYLFKQYGLSRREIDVCKLLLQGYTLRQVGAILTLAYSTVNTYCTSLYRKLDINSRTELLILFKDYVNK